MYVTPLRLSQESDSAKTEFRGLVEFVWLQPYGGSSYLTVRAHLI